MIFSNILPESVRYLIEIYSDFSPDIRLLKLCYLADILDILISGVQISRKMLPLDKTSYSITFSEVTENDNDLQDLLPLSRNHGTI